jgi:CRP/FNR family transcriptional regulator, nitrogen fixation regulation protein
MVAAAIIVLEGYNAIMRPQRKFAEAGMLIDLHKTSGTARLIPETKRSTSTVSFSSVPNLCHVNIDANHAIPAPIEGLRDYLKIGTLIPFACGTEVYSEGESANYLYTIENGAARAYRISASGRRQIVAFYVPGDLFGFEFEQAHTFSVDAVSNTTVRMIRCSAITKIAAQDEDVAKLLWGALAKELRRNQEHVLRLSKTAQERVASFLLEMTYRLPNRGTIKLPMSRRDMADYLGITIETVSRMLTHLTSIAAIRLSGTRDVTILDHVLLKRLTSLAE